MNDDIFVLDCLVHAFDLTEGNIADEVPARAILEAIAYVAGNTGSEYDCPREKMMRNWSVDELAAVLFRESTTSVAVFNPQPIYIFKDGLTAIEKAAEAIRRYPTRFIGTYACVDPLRKGWERDLEEQAADLRPLGLKLYPASWHEGRVDTWDMSDPAIAFPVYEKAAELGITRFAIHKALPVGPLEYRGAFNPKDLEGAAAHFPECDFEIVHGGIAFLEETAWLVGMFPNVHINMENLNIIAHRRPRVFAKILLGLAKVAGSFIYDRLQWGTGSIQYHPQPGLDAFLAFEFPEDLLEEAGLFAPVEQITAEHKQKILADNFANRHGLDLAAIKAAIADDEFARPAGVPLAAPWSSVEAVSPPAPVTV